MPLCQSAAEDRALCICWPSLHLSLVLAWPFKDNVKVKVRRNKALCGGGGIGKDNLIPRKTSLCGIREGQENIVCGWICYGEATLLHES